MALSPARSVPSSPSPGRMAGASPDATGAGAAARDLAEAKRKFLVVARRKQQEYNTRVRCLSNALRQKA